MNLRKAAEMALEALKNIRAWPETREALHQTQAIEALRQALAQPEQECVYPECETGIGCDGPCGSAVEQEPVAWIDRTCLKNLSDCFEPTISKKPVSEYDIPLYAKPVDTVNTSQECVDETAKRGHEPVGYVSESGKGAYILVGADLDDDTPLYTAPPKREWVGLTDEEIIAALEKAKLPSIFSYRMAGKAIETKLREKNT